MRPVLFSLLLLAPVKAQELTSKDAIPSVLVHGEATVSAEPDQANIDIGIVTQAASSQEAADQNAKQANTVMQALRSLLLSASIKTVNFSVNPNYRYPKTAARQPSSATPRTTRCV